LSSANLGDKFRTTDLLSTAPASTRKLLMFATSFAGPQYRTSGHAKWLIGQAKMALSTKDDVLYY